MEWQVNNGNKNDDFVIQSQLLNQDLIRTVDPTPFWGIGDRDLESQDVSSPDSRNAKSQKRLMHKVVVTAHGHKKGRSQSR
jgi:hypothetical protein